MRGPVDGLGTPHPILDRLPAVYHEDWMTRRLTLVFDDALAPVVGTLDNLDAYVDPELAPRDFVEWLAGWVGFPIGETWPEDRSRDLVARASELYRWFGTIKGLRTLLATYAGVEPEITDTGGVSWSTTPGGSDAAAAKKPAGGKMTTAAKAAKTKTKVAPAPEPTGPHLTVRLPAKRARGVDLRQLEELIAVAKPAHVTYSLEVGG